MRYYLEVHSEEHFLNCFEIACLFKIYTTGTDKPHSRFVARLLKEYKAKLGISENFYYKTLKGDLMAVYPSYIYKPLFDKLLEDHPANTDCLMTFENKNHYFKIKKEI